MARARAGKRRARRPRLDWVYRGLEYDNVGLPLATQVSSYNPRTFFYALNAGPASSLATVLVDSSNYLAQAVNPRPQTAFMPTATRPEGRRIVARAIEGEILVTPTTWALGNRLHLGMRFIVAEQDYETGTLLLPVDYQLMEPAVVEFPQDLTHFANGWANLRERRFIQTFDENDREWLFRMRWRGRVSLAHHMCLAVYFESDQDSVNCRFLPKFRTLVETQD